MQESCPLSLARVKESREMVSVFVAKSFPRRTLPGMRNPREESVITPKDARKDVVPNDLRLRFLSASQVRRIHAMSPELGDYGELQLVIQHSELRYINKVESFNAWKNETEK